MVTGRQIFAVPIISKSQDPHWRATTVGIVKKRMLTYVRDALGRTPDAIAALELPFDEPAAKKRVMFVLRRMATYASFSASTVADELPVMMLGLAGTATLGISLQDWRAIMNIWMDRPAKCTETSLHLAIETTGVSVFRVLIADTLSARGTQCKYPSMFSRPRAKGRGKTLLRTHMSP